MSICSRSGSTNFFFKSAELGFEYIGESSRVSELTRLAEWTRFAIYYSLLFYYHDYIAW